MSKVSFSIFCLMFVALSFGVAAMAALVPSISSEFGAPPAKAISLTWLYMLPYGLGALLWPALTQKVKVKNLLIWASGGFCASAFLFSLSTSLNQAFVFRFLMGCFGCSFVPLALITIGKAVVVQKKGKYIGILFGLSYVSTLLSVFLSGFLSWRIIYLIPGVLSLGVIFLIARHLSDFDFRLPKFGFSYLSTLADKKALKFFAVIAIASFFYHGLQQRLGLYLSDSYNLPQMMISLIFTASILGATIFEFAGGFLSNRLGNIRISRYGFILMSIFSLSLIFIGNYKYLFFVVVFWGSGWGLTHVGLSSYLTHFPDKILRDSSGLNSSLRYAFGGMGALAGGIIAGLGGFNFLFAVVGACIFCLGVFLKKIIE
ncbi:MAG: MFS transporter [Candidatus Omnitrophota bacterium]|jgi:MFS family permease